MEIGVLTVLISGILLCSCIIFPSLIKFLYKVWWTPLRVQKLLASQGIRGPPYKFVSGNTIEIYKMIMESTAKPVNYSHDILPIVLPHVHKWMSIYGKNFVYWYGSKAHFVITELALVKEVLNNRSGTYPKPELQGHYKKLLGNGIFLAEGKRWATLRKMANHSFHSDSLKGMIPAMRDGVDMMLERWRDYEEKEIDVYEEFRVMTSDIISRTAFGSSYLEGKHIFEMLMKLAAIATANTYKLRVPGLGCSQKYLEKSHFEPCDPISRTIMNKQCVLRSRGRITRLKGDFSPYYCELLRGVTFPNNGSLAFYSSCVDCYRKLFRKQEDIEAENLESEIQKSIVKIIKNREETMNVKRKADTDRCEFLELLIEANQETDKDKRISVNDMVDECKTFYLAGHETTTSLLAWTCLLLATHTEWQDKARKELVDLFGPKDTVIDYNGISKLKTMNMILNESLRLYPPGVTIARSIAKEVRLGDVILPPNVDILIPNLAIHHDPNIWGKDVHEFKPDRFAEGVANATNNSKALLPFGLGPRTCVGMNFAMIESKIALTKILQRYQFTLSPTYVHSPVSKITNCPQHGVQLMLHSL